MIKKWISAALLATACASASAAPQSYYFTYTGIYEINPFWPEDSTWRPDYRLSGRFDGEDTNHNNVIEKSEITYLRVGERNYLNCTPEDHCGAGGFSFNTSTRDLTFDVYVRYVSEGSSYGGWEASNHGITNEFDFPPYSRQSLWTADTKVMITSVPEPTAFLMMASGLLGLGLLRHRSGQRTA